MYANNVIKAVTHIALDQAPLNVDNVHKINTYIMEIVFLNVLKIILPIKQMEIANNVMKNVKMGVLEMPLIA